MEDRYIKQTMLGQVGKTGQAKLRKAHVIVIGAGGLGSPVLTYLAMAGVGHLTLADSDTVSLSNLNRQFLYDEDCLGASKTDSALERLYGLNSDIEIDSVDDILTEENARMILDGFDLVIGAVDSYEARYAINRAAVRLGIPYIDGGADGFSGRVMFSHPPKTPCLNCVFPQPDSGQSGNAKHAGILGTTSGMVGTIEANIALLWLLGQNNPAENKLLFYDGLKMSMDMIEIKRDGNCPVCKGGAA